MSKEVWTEQEDEILINAQIQMGNKWSYISKLLPGRSENAVKNRYNSIASRNGVRKKRLGNFVNRNSSAKNNLLRMHVPPKTQKAAVNRLSLHIGRERKNKMTSIANIIDTPTADLNSSYADLIDQAAQHISTRAFQRQQRQQQRQQPPQSQKEEEKQSIPPSHGYYTRENASQYIQHQSSTYSTLGNQDPSSGLSSAYSTRSTTVKDMMIPPPQPPSFPSSSTTSSSSSSSLPISSSSNLLRLHLSGEQEDHFGEHDHLHDGFYRDNDSEYPNYHGGLSTRISDSLQLFTRDVSSHSDFSNLPPLHSHSDLSIERDHST